MQHRFVSGSTRALVITASAALAVVAVAGAKTIVGTPGADVLRGTAGSDAIYGRGGDDRLAGMAGNDRLYGGPGADRISCGAGRDSVIADARDVIDTDCEAVRRVNAPAPPHHPPSPPTPAPPPAQPSFVLPGHYVALTAQERYVHLEVYPDGRALTNLRVEFDADCTPPPRLSIPFDLRGDIVISEDGTFAVAAVSSDGRLRLTLAATFDAAGNLSGMFQVDGTVESGEAPRQCHSGTVSFRGSRW